MINNTKDLFNELLDKFNSLNKKDIKAINNFLDEYSMYFERNIFDSVSYNDCTGREYLNNEILKLLNKKINNFNIGDLIIQDSLIRDKRINGLIFYYDAYRCLNELNINKYINVNITFNGKDCDMDNFNININLDDRDLFKDGDISNFLKIRNVIKEYDEKYNRDNKNTIEDYYHDISIYLDNIDIPDQLNSFIPDNYDRDLYSYKTLGDLLIRFEDSRLDKYIDEMISYSKYRDVNSEDNYIIINGIDITGIDEDVLSQDYYNRYKANCIDNRSLEQNGYDKANLLPFIYILIDYVSMGLKNGVLEDNWDNYKNLYEVISRSQSILRLFPDYNTLIKDNKYDIDDRLKVQFIPYKLYDIYNYDSSIVDNWANTNYIDKFEYNSDYYKGDMKSELDTMYLKEYLNRNKVKNKSK